MESLCKNDSQKQHLDKLVQFIQTKELSGTEAWSAFSAPSLYKSFYRKNTFWRKKRFSQAEVKTYKELRQLVRQEIYKRCSGHCSYCRRPVGHYGWAWHIEHVYPKSKYPADTFRLSNLTIGCVHCNQWKGQTVDRALREKLLPIINPLEQGFKYVNHLRYVQIGTESLSFAKYSTHSSKGAKTYQLLHFEELERAYAINGLDGTFAELHDRLTRIMSVGLSSANGQEFVQFLAQIKSSIYKIQ